ncbi:MAG: PEGA domain-containing protein [Prevotella sp.]|nr:PEGA domain-containing protein [Prevotella sp.]
MKQIILFFVVFIPIGCFSQSISVASFKLLESDLTANTAGTMEQDQNGEVAALIKVVTTQTGFTFDGGTLGIVKTKQTPGEIWVYVPRGSKKITIKHPQLGLLRDYYFPLSIDAARTYEMVLIIGEVQTIVKQSSNSQYIVLKVNPKNAIVELNDEILPTIDGIAQKFVKLGTYDYRVQAPDYHTSAGKVEVNDPNSKKIIEINLQPAFGWIEVLDNEDYRGAQVFIDNMLVGTLPMKSNSLPSGEHNLKIVKPLYVSYSNTVVVKDSETTKIAPNLKADFSEVTIMVDNDAEIYVNEEKKGTGRWIGKLASGTYLMEAKKYGHRSTAKNVDISMEQNPRTIQLIPPSPIYGELNITSTPPMADVYIDDSLIGQTPLYIPQLLIGKHKVVLKHKGYADYNSSIMAKENLSSEIIAELKNDVFVKISTNLSTSSIYIDSIFAGRGSIAKMLEVGEHLIEVKDDNNIFVNQERMVFISPDNNEISIFLDEKDIDVTFSYELPKPSRDSYIYLSVDGSDFYPWRDIHYTQSGGILLANDNLKLKLSPGKHDVVIRHKGIDEIRQTIDVHSNHKYFIISFRRRTILTD